MSNVNENCGCDTSYFSVINNSPLLSGSQENDFNPSFVNDINNNSFANNISDNNIEMNSINNNAMNNAMNSMNNNGMNNNGMNNNGMNNNGMNNNGMNNGANNGTTQVISQPNINNLGRNNSNLDPIDYGAMRNMNGVMNNANAVNFNNLDNDIVEESGMKKLLTYLSFALVVIVALAWNDVAKFYINRSIKFQGGNHRYYVYYAVIATMLVAVVVKGVSKLN